MVSNDDSAATQRRQIRKMYDFAEALTCRHAAVVGYFGETIEACADSCDYCTDLGNEPGPVSTRIRSSAPSEVPTGREDLFEDLRVLRKELADERGVPAYIVFNDASLREMAATAPANPHEFLAISGVGQKKLESYGAVFLGLIEDWNRRL